MQAWAALAGIVLAPWERKALMAMDNAYLEERIPKGGEEADDGRLKTGNTAIDNEPRGPGLTMAIFDAVFSGEA